MPIFNNLVIYLKCEPPDQLRIYYTLLFDFPAPIPSALQLANKS